MILGMQLDEKPINLARTTPPRIGRYARTHIANIGLGVRSDGLYRYFVVFSRPKSTRQWLNLTDARMRQHRVRKHPPKTQPRRLDGIGWFIELHTLRFTDE